MTSDSNNTLPFWKIKSLQEMSYEEWESYVMAARAAACINWKTKIQVQFIIPMLPADYWISRHAAAGTIKTGTCSSMIAFV